MKLSRLRYSKTPIKTPRFSQLYLKLRARFSLYFILLILLPCLISAAVIYFHTRGLMEDKAEMAAVESISYEKASVGRYLGELELALDSAGSSVDDLSQDRLIRIKNIEKQSSPLSAMVGDNFLPGQQKALSAVYFITGDGIKASYGPDSDQSVISDPSSQQWFYDAIDNPDTVHMLGTVQRFYAEGKSKPVLCAARALKSVSSAEPKAVLLFDFNYSLLTDILDSSSESGSKISEGSSQRLILDADGNILYSKDRRKLTTKADESLQATVRLMDEGFTRYRLDGVEYYLTYVKYPAFNWIFIDLNPVSNVAERLWLRSKPMTICLIFMLLIILAFPVILLRLLKPINDLTSVISDYENQFPGSNPQIPLMQVKSPPSAFGSTSDVDLLINKIYSIKLRQKEAELNSLQNQINPHFLYNTLESIRGAALYHGIHDIAAMSKALSLLFRYSISDRVLVSIKEELQHLENYISIQNFRYENRFDINYSIPPNLLNYKILKLTLQPLIENSIKHGLEMKLGKGTIRIEMLELDNTIKIQISDDGLGIPPKRLEELNRTLANDNYKLEAETDRTRTGIGVMNVSSRIKLYFGEQYGLRFRSALTGTIVEITLPAVSDA
jgi:two-component system sensor histidine kinase YesM